MFSRRFRIAIWYNLPSGGAKRALYNHMAGLKARGHTLEVFRPPLQDMAFMPTSEVADRETEIPWEPWIQGPQAGIPGRFREVFRLLETAEAHAKTAGEAIDKGHFDLLYAHNCMYMASPFIGRYVSIPKMLYLPEPNRPLYEPMPRLPWLAPDLHSLTGVRRLKGKARYWIDARSAALRGREELLNAKAFDRILVNSYFSRESLLRAYGLNSRVCYLGIDPGMFTNHHAERKNFIMGVGTLGPTKNVLFAVESVGRIPETVRPELIWVANMTDPPYRDQCVERAKELGVKFTYKSMISDSELVQLLNEAKLMIYAPRLEPFGLAPMEANMCGLPVVAVAEGGVRETVLHEVNGLVVDHDPDQCAAAIMRLTQDDQLRKQLGTTGEARAKTVWSYESSIDRVEAEILSLLRL